MSGIQKIPIQPKYIQEDSLRPELPFKVEVLQFVTLPPKAIGGNHKHPRTEAFLALSKGLEFHWQDENGKSHIESLAPNEIIAVSPSTPHGVTNTSAAAASVVEWADAIQYDVVPSDVIRTKE